MASPGKITAVHPANDHPLRPQGATTENEASFQIAHLLSIVLADPNFDLSVENLSRASGYTRTRIVQLQGNPSFKRIFDYHLEQKAASIMGKGLGVISEILSDPDEGSQRKLQAVTATATVSRALNSGREQHENDQGEVDAMKLLKKLEQKNQLTRAHVEVIDSSPG
jgi:hypothetical protein